MPVTASRSATSERTCARTTSADRSLERSICRGRPPERDQPVPDGRGRPAGAQLVGDRVGALREVVQQRRRTPQGSVRAGSTPPPPGVPARGCCAARSPAARRARPSRAPGPGAGAGTARSAPPTAPRRQPRGARRPARRSIARPAAPPATARRPRRAMLSAAARSSVGDLAYDDRRLLARAPQRRPGYDGSGDQRDAAADQGVGPPDERRAGVGTSVLTTMACTAAWLTNSTPWPSSSAVDIARRDDQRDLPAARSQPVGQQVADEHPDRDTDRHLGDPPQPLAVAGAEADHGGDRREERRRVAEHVGRERSTRPRRRRRTGRSATPCARRRADALAQRGPAAGDRASSRCGAAAAPVAGQVLPRATS